MRTAFSPFVGSESLVASLAEMIDEGRLPHAVILVGEVGSGRHTLAAALARGVACVGQGERPCGKCAACRCADNPDVITVCPERTEITVGQIRAVREQSFIAPNQSAARVFIIPDAGQMNETAQNALLKVLEEPPQQVYFILTVQYPHQLIETILSRAVAFRLQAPSVEQSVARITQLHPEYSAERARDAFCQLGTIGAALNGLEGGSEASAVTDGILSALTAEQELELLRALQPIAGSRQLAEQVLCELLRRLHGALAAKMGAERSSDGVPDGLGAESIVRLISVCEDERVRCRSNIGEALLATHLCAGLRRAINL